MGSSVSNTNSEQQKQFTELLSYKISFTPHFLVITTKIDKLSLKS